MMFQGIRELTLHKKQPPKLRLIVPYVVAFFACEFHSYAGTTTWEEQALRLQNVSATLLDAYPVAEPLRANIGLEGKAIMSFLPKTNAHVGGKDEKAPSSPIHTVPTVQGNFALPNTGTFGFGGQIWGGYLPSGTEGLIGLKAKINETIYGLALVPQYNLPSLSIYLSLGYQHSSAEVKGAITAPDASDKFSAKTKFTYFAPGIRIPSLSMWANVMIGAKDTTSVFEIPADHTNIELRDTLSDSSPGYVHQYSIGWWGFGGFQLGISEVVVPKRIMMPRVMFSYQYAIGKT